jgi:hypothetical protein
MARNVNGVPLGRTWRTVGERFIGPAYAFDGLAPKKRQTPYRAGWSAVSAPQAGIRPATNTQEQRCRPKLVSGMGGATRAVKEATLDQLSKREWKKVGIGDLDTLRQDVLLL